jgi:hypothetical protein
MSFSPLLSSRSTFFHTNSLSKILTRLRKTSLENTIPSTMASDPRHFDVDPDLDPTFDCDANPDPGPTFQF